MTTTSPTKTSPAVVTRIISLRLRKRLGPLQLGVMCGVAPPSTAHQVLRRCRLNRLSYTDRATGEPVRRYEHDHPGDVIHVDVTKFGNIPDGGGWRFVGRRQGGRHRAATPEKPRTSHHNQEFHRLLEPYVNVARKVTATRTSRRESVSARAHSRAIRAWAQGQGLKVAARGKTLTKSSRSTRRRVPNPAVAALPRLSKYLPCDQTG